MSAPENRAPQDIAVPPSSGPKSSNLRITALAAGGRGVGRQDDRVWFVPGGLPGDRVRARPFRERPSYVEGRIVSLLVASPDRRTAPCPLQDSCGGCPWMSLPAALQRHWKEKLLGDALTRIGGLESPRLERIRRPVRDLAYRNRVEFTWGRGGSGEPVIGLHHRESERGLVDVDRCAIQTGPADAILRSIRSFLLEPRGGAVNPGDGFRISIRYSEAEQRGLVGLFEGPRRFPRARELARFLADSHPDLAGVVRLHGRGERRGGQVAEVLHGRGWIRESIAGTGFRVPAATFLQVNSPGAEALVELVREMAQPVDGAHALDLYGGVGTFAFALLRSGAASVTVCDADRDAVHCGREAARRTRSGGIRFAHAGVERFLKQDRPRSGVELVVANPPRSGMRRRVTRLLGDLGARRIVLVSCDPSTLARDLRSLVESGYAVRRIVPVDLFPQTAHVETVVLLERPRVPRPGPG